MLKPDLQLLASWLDITLVSLLEDRRRKAKEWRRHRKLATLETLWLMLAVSLDTQRSSLHEILRLACGQLHMQWSVSVAAFCKARARFSPGCPDLAIRHAGEAIAGSLQRTTQPLARHASAGRGQDDPCLAGIPISLEGFRWAQGAAGIGPDCRRTLLSF